MFLKPWSFEKSYKQSLLKEVEGVIYYEYVFHVMISITNTCISLKQFDVNFTN